MEKFTVQFVYHRGPGSHLRHGKRTVKANDADEAKCRMRQTLDKESKSLFYFISSVPVQVSS